MKPMVRSLQGTDVCTVHNIIQLVDRQLCQIRNVVEGLGGGLSARLRVPGEFDLDRYRHAFRIDEQEIERSRGRESDFPLHRRHPGIRICHDE